MRSRILELLATYILVNSINSYTVALAFLCAPVFGWTLRNIGKTERPEYPVHARYLKLKPTDTLLR